LARALAVNPALLLMDEPLSNLDARLREEVRANIKKLVSQLGITVLYVTHDQVEAMVLADRVAVMTLGEILQIGDPFELYRAPASSMVAEFFGSINWLRGKMRDGGSADTDIGRLVIAPSRQYVGNVVLGVRPEDIKLAPAPAPAENELEGTVVGTTFLGDQVMTEVKIKERNLLVKTLPDGAKPRGKIMVQLPKERIVIFPESHSGS